jgi:hypothetical protein
MAQFHFVEDYERHVADLIEKHPMDEAMSLAVGGSFNEIGAIEADILRYAGLKDGYDIDRPGMRQWSTCIGPRSIDEDRIYRDRYRPTVARLREIKIPSKL